MTDPVDKPAGSNAAADAVLDNFWNEAVEEASATFEGGDEPPPPPPEDDIVDIAQSVADDMPVEPLVDPLGDDVSLEDVVAGIELRQEKMTQEYQTTDAGIDIDVDVGEPAEAEQAVLPPTTPADVKEPVKTPQQKPTAPADEPAMSGTRKLLLGAIVVLTLAVVYQYWGRDFLKGPQETVPSKVPVAVKLDKPPVKDPAPPKVEDAKPEDAKPEDAKPEDTKPDDAKPEDTKPDDAKPEDTKPDDASSFASLVQTGVIVGRARNFAGPEAADVGDELRAALVKSLRKSNYKVGRTGAYLQPFLTALVGGRVQCVIRAYEKKGDKDHKRVGAKARASAEATSPEIAASCANALATALNDKYPPR